MNNNLTHFLRYYRFETMNILPWVKAIRDKRLRI